MSKSASNTSLLPERPTKLTKFLITKLNDCLNDQIGYFQIVEFHKKYQKNPSFYSTHISDGYFKIKVIFLDKACRQLDEGHIKLFSILHGAISNEGNQIFMVRKPVTVWEFPRSIGIIKNWKPGRANINTDGNNTIDWVSIGIKCGQEFPFSATASLTDVNGPTKSESQRSLTYICSPARSHRKNNANKNNKISKLELLLQRSTQSMKQSPEIKNDRASNSQKKSIHSLKQQPFRLKDELLSLQNHSAHKKSQKSEQKLHKLKINKSDESNNQEEEDQFDFIWKKVKKIQESFDSNRQGSETKQKKSMKKDRIAVNQQSASSKKYKSVEDINFYSTKKSTDKQDEPVSSWSLKEKNTIKSIKAISEAYKCKNNPQPVSKAQISKVRLNQGKSDQLCKSIEKTPFLSSKMINNINDILDDMSDQEPQFEQRPLENHILDKDEDNDDEDWEQEELSKLIGHSINSYDHQTVNRGTQNITPHQNNNQNWRDDDELTISQLFPTTQLPQNKWILVYLLHIEKVAQNENTLIAILKGLKDGKIINMFIDGSTSELFQIGAALYLGMKGISIKESAIPHPSVQVQLQAQSCPLKIEEYKSPQSINQQQQKQQRSGSCYSELQKLVTMREDVFVHVAAVIKTVFIKQTSSSSKAHNGNSKNSSNPSFRHQLTLADPFTQSTMDCCLFLPHKLVLQPNQPILLYNAYLGHFKNAKQLTNKRRYTCFLSDPQIDHLPVIQSCHYLSQIFQWVKDNKIQFIIDNIEKYEEVAGLKTLQINKTHNNISSQLYCIPKCRIVAINDKHHYLACNKCNKKVTSLVFCYGCGRIEEKNVSKKLYIMATLGDHTCCLQVLWGHEEAQLLIGSTGDRFEQFRQQYLNEYVKVWVKKDPNADIIKAVKAVKLDAREVVGELWAQMKDRMKYL